MRIAPPARELLQDQAPALARNRLDVGRAERLRISRCGRDVDPPVRDVLSDMDLWWVRFQTSFMRGILNLKDVVFYLANIYFFLLLAVKTLESKRWQ